MIPGAMAAAERSSTQVGECVFVLGEGMLFKGDLKGS